MKTDSIRSVPGLFGAEDCEKRLLEERQSLSATIGLMKISTNTNIHHTTMKSSAAKHWTTTQGTDPCKENIDKKNIDPQLTCTVWKDHAGCVQQLVSVQMIVSLGGKVTL